jgi:glycyl-tRNA synthetase
VSQLKDAKSDPEEIKVAVDRLKQLKATFNALAAEATAKANEHLVFRRQVDSLLLRRFFYVNAFEIYGGVGGLFDYGPPGCALKDNIVELWRQHFVMTESMLEVSTACVTPEVVLKTSGHVDKFTDFMVTDAKTGECFRADKLLEAKVDEIIADNLNPVTDERRRELLAIRTAADDYSQEELGKVMQELNVCNPGVPGNVLSAPYPFNLMFVTSIGPTGKQRGYLRPETAQGIFTNFRRLLDYNNGQMPFACAQIGLAFRNEIAPRSGLLRVREFPMMEIEHFVDPQDKSHIRFATVREVVLTLLDRKGQTGEDITTEIAVGDAVDQGMIANETLGYFMARTQLFLLKIGADRSKLRFRQHKANEMAHYAQDCWDAEMHTTYGWIECVGHADRSAYDLQVHTNESKVNLMATKDFKTPQSVSLPHAQLNNKVIGQKFGRNQGPLRKFFKDASNEQLLDIKTQLEAKSQCTVQTDSGDLLLESSFVTITMRTKNINSVKYIPSVIEPSFGLGRCMYSILEHAYRERKTVNKNGEKISYLALSSACAPIKAGVLTQTQQESNLALSENMTRLLVARKISYRCDDSSVALGRKYARCDEVGTPFAIVLDIQSSTDQKCTIRERDSTTQVRVTFERAADLIQQLVNGDTTWEQVYATEEKFLRPETE